MKRSLKGWSLICVLLLVIVPLIGLADGAENTEQMQTSLEDYAGYVQKLEVTSAVQTSVTLYEAAEGVEFSEGQSITLKVSVPEDMYGYPAFSYAMTGSNILDNAYTLLVDGVLPYSECSSLTLDSIWTQTGEFDTDRYGNEVVSMPVKSYDATTCRLMGKAGLYSEGMGLYL